MSQQKSFSKKMYLPFKQKCLHRWMGERPFAPGWNRRLSGRDSYSTAKAQHCAVCEGKEKNNTKKATEESFGIQHSSLAPFISATEKQK